MTKKQVSQLPLGIYRIHWKESCGGGTSVAAVGNLYDGQRWLAPTNWTAPVGSNPTGYGNKTWIKIKKVTFLIAE